MEKQFVGEFLARLSAKYPDKSLSFNIPQSDIDPFDGLVMKKGCPQRPVSLAALQVKLGLAEQVAQDIVNLNVKFLKRPEGYEGPLQLSFPVDVSGDIVCTLKEKISKKISLPQSSLKLVLKGKVLVDDRLFKEYIDASTGSEIVIHCQILNQPAEKSDVSTDKHSLSTPTQLKTAVSDNSALPEEFWTELRGHLERFLPSDQCQRVMERFRNSLVE